MLYNYFKAFIQILDIIRFMEHYSCGKDQP